MTIKHVPVVHKRSSVAGKVPTAEMLRSGELAINTADGLVYAKKDDDSVIAIGASPDLSSYAETSYVDTEITNANSTTKGLYEHANTIAANYTIATGNNALTAGPITINTGVSVTVPTGSTWVIA